MARGEKIAGVLRALILFIVMFFGWFAAPARSTDHRWTVGIAESLGVDTTANAWQSYDFIDLLLLVTIVVAVGGAIATAMARDVALPVAVSALTAGLGILGFVFVVFRIIDTPSEGPIDLDREFWVVRRRSWLTRRGSPTAAGCACRRRGPRSAARPAGSGPRIERPTTGRRCRPRRRLQPRRRHGAREPRPPVGGEVNTAAALGRPPAVSGPLRERRDDCGAGAGAERRKVTVASSIRWSPKVLAPVHGLQRRASRDVARDGVVLSRSKSPIVFTGSRVGRTTGEFSSSVELEAVAVHTTSHASCSTARSRGSGAGAPGISSEGRGAAAGRGAHPVEVRPRVGVAEGVRPRPAPRAHEAGRVELCRSVSALADLAEDIDSATSAPRTDVVAAGRRRLSDSLTMFAAGSHSLARMTRCRLRAPAIRAIATPDHSRRRPRARMVLAFVGPGPILAQTNDRRKRRFPAPQAIRSAAGARPGRPSR